VIARADRLHIESSERRDEDEPSLDLKFARSLRIFDYEALTIPDCASDCYDKVTRPKHLRTMDTTRSQNYDSGTQVMKDHH
jgi:hypothetical protein